jgi:hypothetical protein
MSDLPSDPEPASPLPYPEITPASVPDEARQTSPAPGEDDTGRPHDADGTGGPHRAATALFR